MTHSADLSLVHLKTGTTLEEFRLLAIARGFIEHCELMHWLKSEFEIEHGHATRISHLILPEVARAAPDDKKIASQFKGPKADWLPAYNELKSKVGHFGKDVNFVPEADAILINRKGVTFGLLKVSSSRLLIGINLPDAPYDETFISARNWTQQVSHSVAISLQQQINDELISWLRAAYARSS